MEMMIIHVKRIMQLHLIVLGDVSRTHSNPFTVEDEVVDNTMSMQPYALVEEVILAQGRIRFPVWSRTLYLISVIRFSFKNRALEIKTL